MIDTDEVDEDYFTPVAGTTLENIFNNISRDNETENETLKYIPLKPPAIPKPGLKATQCLIACAFFAYEWNSNAYVEKGKLGFAIMKYLKTDSHDIVLYDSNKATLTKSTITTKSQICLVNKLYLSFYDNNNKFWCINGTEKEIEKVIGILKTLNVVIKYTENENTLPSPEISSNMTQTEFIGQTKQENASDTDSLTQDKAKAAILTRMANMGQSVLPPRVVSPKKLSDNESSDPSYDSDCAKAVRKKSFKNNVKRTDQMVYEHKNITPVTKSSEESYTIVNGTFLPIATSKEGMTNLLMKPDTDLSFFMTEQRVSNSEIRINLGRLSDKIDQILDSVKDTQNKQLANAQSSCQFEIVQKLLLEYENKIKRYEQIIESNKLKKETSQLSNDIEFYKAKVLNLEEIIREKDKEIEALTKRLKLVSKNEK